MSLLLRNPYEVLGIASDAADTGLQKAYRRLAMEHHPDRNPDDPDSEKASSSKSSGPTRHWPHKEVKFSIYQIEAIRKVFLWDVHPF